VDDAAVRAELATRALEYLSLRALERVGSMRLNGRVVGFGLVTRFSAGSAAMEFGSSKKSATALRRAARAHRRVVVHLTVRDWAGNKRIYDRSLRLAP